MTIARQALLGSMCLLLCVDWSVAQTPTSSDSETNLQTEKLLGAMTIEEKIDYISGDQDGFSTKAIPRLGIPAFRMTDGPLGTRNDGPTTAYGAGIALASTWNVDLAGEIGRQLGLDARARGVQIVLGPGVDIYRSPRNGYNFQHFGEDPFLTSRIAVGYIRGMQNEGVSADIKHLIGNNSEYDRHSTDSIIDERALREIYLPPYEAAVKEAKVGTVMNGYNLTNGQYMSESYKFNVGVLRNEWGFNGFVMPDWTGTRDTAAVANGGLDLEMPVAKVFTQAALKQAIQEGKVSVATIDDKVRHILNTAYRFGWMDHTEPDYSIPLDSQTSRAVSLQTARESIVLLKNEGQLLPLDRTKIHSIAVIGPDAYPAQATGAGAAHVNPFTEVSFLEGISDLLSGKPEVLYDRGIWNLNKVANFTDFTTAVEGGEPGLRFETFANADFAGGPVSSEVVRHINTGLGGAGGVATDPESNPNDRMWAHLLNHASSAVRWSGFYTADHEGNYHMFVETGERFSLAIDGRTVIDNRTIAHAFLNDVTIPLTRGSHRVVLGVLPGGADNFRGLRLRFGIQSQEAIVTEAAKAIASKADVVVLAVGFDSTIEGEGHDREYALPFGQEELIQTISALNKNVIVLITSGGSVATERWLSAVPALLEAWYPGDQGGTAFAEILFGTTNPSGHLPITWEKQLEDDPSYSYYYPEPGTNRAVYREGIYAGYRGFDRNGKQPLFPFGYGQSYTKFKFDDLKLNANSIKAGDPVTVSFAISNTGGMTGKAVAEVYVHAENPKVDRPEKQLKGFVKIELKPGETKRESITLDPKAFAFYDVAAKVWRTEPGEYSVLLGTSVEDIQGRELLHIVP